MYVYLPCSKFCFKIKSLRFTVPFGRYPSVVSLSDLEQFRNISHYKLRRERRQENILSTLLLNMQLQNLVPRARAR